MWRHEKARPKWPGFAHDWHEAQSAGDPDLICAWIESARCFFDGEPLPPDNPVRVTTIAQVLRMMGRDARGTRGK